MKGKKSKGWQLGLLSLFILLIIAGGMTLYAVRHSDDFNAPNGDERYNIGRERIQIASYNELIEVLKEKKVITQKPKKQWWRMDDKVTTGVMESSASSSMNTGEAGGLDYSRTNTQVQGVDEADTVKNDERYIYTRTSDHEIVILDTKEVLKVVSRIECMNGFTISEFFLDGNTLIATGNKEVYESNQSFSGILVYDLTDKTNPILMREVEVEGYLSQIRKVDEVIYMISNRWNPIVYFREYEQEDVVPCYRDTATSEEQKLVAIENIYYEPWSNAEQYMILTTVNLKDESPAKIQATLGGIHDIYMTKEVLYLASTDYRDEVRTQISKYQVEKDKVTFIASGSVKGTILNQFSMDEYEGNFRIATTDYKANQVYILDEYLEVMGKIENMAPGESIYSVRFEEQRGYVVTFEQVDPLFVLDLSDPIVPKILGELKIPGFSQYLHPMGNDLMVGIGRSTYEVIRRDEDGVEQVTGVTTAGIKLSLFDISNPEAPKEINHITLGDSGSYSEALENHKAVMVHLQKQLLAIPVELVYPEVDKSFRGAYVFGIENGELVGKAKLGQENAEDYYGEVNRVCYIGSQLYYVYGDQVSTYDMNTFKKLQTLSFKG